MRSSTLILIACVVVSVIAGGSKEPCTGGKSATAGGEMGPSKTLSSITTSTSTITVIAGGSKEPCTGGKSATAGGEMGPSKTLSSTTTITSTITVRPSCSHMHTHPHTSRSTGAGELTSKSKPSKTKPNCVPTGGPTKETSNAGGYWTSAAYGNHSTMTTESAQTTLAGVSTSAGKTAPAPTISLTAGGRRVEMGWMGGLVIGMVGVMAGLL